MSERLRLMPLQKWKEIKSIFKLVFPRSIYGYNFLDNMEDFEKKGLGYGSKVYCPLGDASNGLVVLNLKKNFKINKLIPSVTLLLDKNTAPSHASLPRGYSFHHLTLKDLQMVNYNWPHKYPGSEWYFELLIKANYGYGLFKGNELLTWAFLREGGDLGNFCTSKDHRNKGYGSLVMRLFSKILLEKKDNVFFSCVKANTVAINLYQKMGFTPAFEEEWGYFTSSIN